jgi:hypothetical protein
MNRQAKPVGSVENDPKPTFLFAPESIRKKLRNQFYARPVEWQVAV